jgi:uncharacterized protein YigA (DUF484 family)
MHHPELEKQLEELKEQKRQAAQDLSDLANEAIENADRASKTMMMYLQPAGLNDACDCTGKFCTCTEVRQKPATSRLFKKMKKALKNGKHKHDGD